MFRDYLGSKYVRPGMQLVDADGVQPFCFGMGSNPRLLVTSSFKDLLQ